MLRLTLLVTGLVSFLHFAFPQNFAVVKKNGDVLGISHLETAVNKQTVETALQIYCVNNLSLPNKLNELYGNELDPKKYLDLEQTFNFERKDGCDFTLTNK